MVELANRGYLEEEKPPVTDAAMEIAALVGMAAVLGVISISYLRRGEVILNHQGVNRRLVGINGHLPLTDDLVASIRTDVAMRSA